jgi:hypothetical protein
MTDSLILRLPDPEALGKIRNIVKTAHKWGGDGTKPKFRKIKQVLLSKHPQVIAKAFGGNADVAAAWIKDQWMALHGHSPKGKTGSGPTFWRGKGKSTKASQEDVDDTILMLDSWFQGVPEGMAEDEEIFCADGDVSEEGGLIWKECMRVGEWRHPNGGKKPLKVDMGYMQDLLEAFEDGAWEHVTVPLTHEDRVEENTGYVRQLRIVGSSLYAGIEFTEPDIRDKALRGTIANVSVGISPVETTEVPTKFFPRVLKHIALTPKPWINRMKPFGVVAASQDGKIVVDYASYEVDEEVEEENFASLEDIDLQKKDVLWNDQESFEWIRSQIDKILIKNRADTTGVTVLPDGTTPVPVPDYYCMGLTTDRVLIGNYNEHYSGAARGFVSEYEVKDGQVELDPVDEWEPVEKTWVSLSLEFTVVDPQGWEAAWNEAHEIADLPEGVTREQLIDGLLRSKPKDVEVAASADDKLTGGGDNKVPEENEKEEQEQKDAPKEPQLTLSRDELDRMVDERASAIVEDRVKASDERLALAERELHRSRVEKRVSELQTAGHAPAVVKAAKAIYDADSGGVTLRLSKENAEALNLSREGEEEASISVSGVVDALLASFPQSSLVVNQPSIPRSADAPDEERTVEDRAVGVMKDLGLEIPATNGGAS